jgi:hypothetical protein
MSRQHHAQSRRRGIKTLQASINACSVMDAAT